MHTPSTEHRAWVVCHSFHDFLPLFSMCQLALMKTTKTYTWCDCASRLYLDPWSYQNSLCAVLYQYAGERLLDGHSGLVVYKSKSKSRTQGKREEHKRNIMGVVSSVSAPALSCAPPPPPAPKYEHSWALDAQHQPKRYTYCKQWWVLCHL